MFTYKKYNKYLIAVVIIISLSANLFFAIQLKILKKKLVSSNTVTSIKVESAIRDTMYSIKELNKTTTEETINDLRLSSEQLVLIFNNWIDLNQLEEKPNESLMNGLSALETLRNTVVYHLGNQYSNNGELTDYDIVFLDKVYGKLDRLLIIYNNIEKRLDKIKNTDDKDDGGLSQWVANVEEICRLYRHSRIPNEHPEYIELDPILIKAEETFPVLKNFKGSRDIKESVQIQDGVHYYEIGYYYEDELSYLVWMDAIDGSIRLFEDYTEVYNEKLTSKFKALNIAKSYVNKLESYEELKETMSIITDEKSNNTIYAFKFIPIIEDIAIISDSININITSKEGRLIKYSSNFSNTMVAKVKPLVSLEEIEEENEEQLINMEYDGLSIVRSFYTHYRPVLAYNYKSIEKENITKLYFDVVSGHQVQESYSVYAPIVYITSEDYY